MRTEKGGKTMFTVPELASEALGSFISSFMMQRFGSSHTRLTEVVPSLARLALECIGNSDALYHNVEHTMLVTLAGHDILRGRFLLEGREQSKTSKKMAGCCALPILLVNLGTQITSENAMRCSMSLRSAVSIGS